MPSSRNVHRISIFTVARLALVAVAALLIWPSSAFAGGAWVPGVGDGDIQLGFSRKTAHTSWDAYGDTIENTGRFQNHDFRYTYLSGEVGVVKRLSFTFLFTWLDGLEGPDGDLHRNVGFSDSWLGLKYALRGGSSPMALKLVVRTPFLYDISGPYSLELYDQNGEFLGLSPEWRGLLKHDVTLGFMWSRSIVDYRGWINVDTGYTWREGAPADQWPIHVDAGVPVLWKGGSGPWSKLRAKASLDVVFSLGNDSAREPDDRFGGRASFNFNDASMARVALAFLQPFGKDDRWTVEAGYGIWVWGESARQYEEPFVSIGRTF